MKRASFVVHRALGTMRVRRPCDSIAREPRHKAPCHIFARLSFSLVVCFCVARSMGEDLRSLPVTGETEERDESRDIYVANVDVSETTGKIFQGVVLRPRNESRPVEFYVWEVSAQGTRLHEWRIDEDTTAKRVPFPRTLFPCLRVLPSGDIVAITVHENRVPSIVKVDADGDVVFKRPLFQQKKLPPHFFDLVVGPEGQIVAVGTQLGKAFVLKLDRQGNPLFEKVIDVEGKGVCASVAPASDGGFYVCGYSRNDDAYTSWLVELDTHGDLRRRIQFDDASLACMPENHRIARLNAEQIAFLRPVSAEGRTFCRLTVLDGTLKEIDETNVCEVPRFVGRFELDRYKDGVVVAAQTDVSVVSLYLLDEQYRATATYRHQVALRDPFAHALAVRGEVALLLAQKKGEASDGTNAVRCTIVALESR